MTAKEVVPHLTSPSANAKIAAEYHAGRLKLATEFLLPKADGGHRSSALELAALCAAAIKDGCVVPAPLSDWLTRVLYRLGQGYSFEKAAGVPKRGQGQKIEHVARAAAGRRYCMAHQFGVLHKHEHMKEVAAQMEVADLFEVSPHTVEAAWKEHHANVLREIALEVEYLGKVTKFTRDSVAEILK